jgi:hypothetical protein
MDNGRYTRLLSILFPSNYSWSVLKRQISIYLFYLQQLTYWGALLDTLRNNYHKKIEEHFARCGEYKK